MSCRLQCGQSHLEPRVESYHKLYQYYRHCIWSSMQCESSLSPWNMLLIVTFVIENLEMFETESEIHAFSTRHGPDLHRGAANLTVCQKRVDCAGVGLYNKPRFKIKCLSTNDKQFKITVISCDSRIVLCWKICF